MVDNSSDATMEDVETWKINCFKEISSEDDPEYY